MDEEEAVYQQLVRQASQNGHNSSDESVVPMDCTTSDDGGGSDTQSTKLLRKPLSRITKSYKEKKHQCKQCGAEFAKKLDMHIHRLTHADTDETENQINQAPTQLHSTQTQADTGSDTTVQKMANQPQSKTDLLRDQENNSNQDSIQNNQVIEPTDESDLSQDGSYINEEGVEDQYLIDDENLNKEINNLKSKSKDYEDMLSSILADAGQSKYHLDIIVPAPKRTYQCGPCNKRFDDYSSYLQHREDHPNPKLYQCSTCSKGFTIKGNLTRHEQIHKDLRMFECEHCHKKFSQKTHLVAHLGTHTRKPFMCKCCGMIFHKEPDLRVHLFNEHQLEQSTNDVCQINSGDNSGTEELLPQQNSCVEKYSESDIQIAQNSIGDYGTVEGAVDMLRVGDMPPETYYRNINYTCGTCGIVFFDFQTYISHKKDHPTPKLFACEQCGKSFTVKGNLQRHLQIHQDIRLHECEICHKKFSQKTHLAAHMHVHSKERPYICTLCGGSFTREGNLRRHIKMHASDRKEEEQELEKSPQHFKCEQCFKTFMRKGNLKRHQKLHTT